MPVKTVVTEGKPIVVCHMLGPLNMPQDADTVIVEVLQIKRKLGRSLYRIMDFTTANLQFSDMMVGMSYDKGKEGGTYDPEIKTIFVGDYEMVKFGTEAMMSQEHFKGANVVGVTASVAEALDLAHKLLSKE
ncbi:MAG: hypothetical protein HY866_11865 [Chloroflexi bacterium]|nr:hypothetical protein [Chloroflexota bacterium]